MASGKRILVCVRHGESEWNKENRFCGWVDVGLSEKGVEEAVEAAKAIRDEGLEFDVVYTSLLKRAVDTARIIVEQNCRGVRPEIRTSWRLNERHYGALTGLDKAELAEEYGKSQVQIWRRSFDVLPPPMKDDHPFFQSIVGNEKFQDILDAMPRAECLKSLVERTLPYWETYIRPDVMSGRRVLIVCHGTSLRGLVKHIEGLTDAQVAQLNLPNGIPFVYELDKETLNPVSPKRFLADDETVKKAVEKVASIRPTK